MQGLWPWDFSTSGSLGCATSGKPRVCHPKWDSAGLGFTSVLSGGGLGGSNLSLLCFCNCVGAFAGAVLAEVLTIWESCILLGGKTAKAVTSVKPPAHLSCRKCSVTKLKHVLVSDAVGLQCLGKGPVGSTARAPALCRDKLRSELALTCTGVYFGLEAERGAGWFRRVGSCGDALAELFSTSVDIPQAEPVIHEVPLTLLHLLPLSLLACPDPCERAADLGAVCHLMLHFLVFFFLFISLPLSAPCSREP